MPHQPIQSQGDESASYNRGNPYYPYSSDSSAPPFPLGQYPDAVYGGGGYGMMTPAYNNPRQQLFYPATAPGRQWANIDDTNQKTQDYKADNLAREREKKSTSNESDEEAAVTALLMAGGSRSENVETMQAAVRMKKQMMHEKNAKQSSSNNRVKILDSTVKESEHESKPKNHGQSNKSPYPSREVNPSREVKNFPNVLHGVLTKSEYAGTVLEWLSHGKSWRVLRWDELSDAVIPAYFPDLCVKSKTGDTVLSSTERMNMFIRQIKSWGFKEVREIGPDLGSFQHEVS